MQDWKKKNNNLRQKTRTVCNTRTLQQTIRQLDTGTHKLDVIMVLIRVRIKSLVREMRSCDIPGLMRNFEVWCQKCIIIFLSTVWSNAFLFVSLFVLMSESEKNNNRVKIEFKRKINLNHIKKNRKNKQTAYKKIKKTYECYTPLPLWKFLLKKLKKDKHTHTHWCSKSLVMIVSFTWAK